MQRRATMTRSSGLATRAKMKVSLALLACYVVGSAVGYNVRREAPYNVGPNDPYVAVNPNYLQERSQRLFWGNQGSNQVGGTGWWATMTNKFPFLEKMFGRMELETQYGAPNQYVSSQYGVPSQYDLSSQYGAPGYQQHQYNQVPQFYQQRQQTPQQFATQQFGQRFVPSGRDVGLTDDAVIVTPPFVPIAPQPQPAPVPIPAPAPVPVAPAPAPEPSPGYQYNKPQFRLELPYK